MSGRKEKSGMSANFETSGKGKSLYEKILKMCLCVNTFVGMFMYGGFYCQAAHMAQNVGQWFLDQAFWLGIIAIGIALVLALTKRAWVQAVIIVVAGSVILYFIQTPEAFKQIGTTLGNIVMNGEG